MLGNNHIVIYPNPVSNRMVIRSLDFQYNRIEVVDITGVTVLRESVAYEPELHIPLNLPSGLYIVRISNNEQFRHKKILVRR